MSSTWRSKAPPVSALGKYGDGCRSNLNKRGEKWRLPHRRSMTNPLCSLAPLPWPDNDGVPYIQWHMVIADRMTYGSCRPAVFSRLRCRPAPSGLSRRSLRYQLSTRSNCDGPASPSSLPPRDGLAALAPPQPPRRGRFIMRVKWLAEPDGEQPVCHDQVRLRSVEPAPVSLGIDCSVRLAFVQGGADI